MMMKLRETLAGKQPRVVLGVFHNTEELYRACAVLTDFGYPKESARITSLGSVVTVDGPKRVTSLLQRITTRRVIITALLAILVTLAAVATAELASPTAAASSWWAETVLTVLLAGIFLALGSLACGLLGLLLWAALQPLLRTLNPATAKAPARVALRIKARTPLDAKDIAQAWSEIGGRVIGPGNAAVS